MEMKWYTIYTMPKVEKKVSDLLDKKKIKNFCPVKTISLKESKIKDHDYFNRFVFVNVCENKIAELKNINGVVNIMYWKNKPAIIDECEIELIKSFFTRYTNIQVEKRHVGPISSIHALNSQKENEAKLVDMNNSKIKAVLPSLGYVMFAEFQKSVVHLSQREVVSANSKSIFNYRLAK